MTGTAGTRAPSSPVRRKRFTGIVASAGRMAQTITVAVERFPWHPKVSKQVRRTHSLLVHDPHSTAAVGDRVVIEETRPLSKRKHFRLLSIEKRHESS